MNRNGNRLKFPVKIGKVEVHDISDRSKLLWGEFYGPMQAAAQQLNAAIIAVQNTVAKAIIEREGLKPEEWLFDMDRLRLQRKPSE